MRATAYLYVITERYPKSGTPWLNQNHPQMICRTQEEAQFVVEELRRIATGSGEPISYEYVRVPLVEIPEQVRNPA